jgi:hypothetical protein
MASDTPTLRLPSPEPCWCENDDTTGGHYHNPPGVYEAMQLEVSVQCSMGHHEWVPWLRLDSGSFVTFCIHCRRREQWDV